MWPFLISALKYSKHPYRNAAFNSAPSTPPPLPPPLPYGPEALFRIALNILYKYSMSYITYCTERS